MITIGANFRGIKKFVMLNKRLYLLSCVLFVIFFVLGVVLVSSGQMDETVYTSQSTTITEIIVSDYSAVGLFFDGLVRLIFPLVIIFVLFLSKYTYFFGFVYYGYQALLLGGSTASLITTNGFAGVLNALVVVLPINILNFFIVASGLVVFYKRLKLSQTQKISLSHGLKILFPKILWLLVGALFSAAVYGFVYPLLLRSMVIVNV